MNPSAPWTLTARWIFPVSGPPLERGTVTVAGERIAAVEPRGRRAADVDLGNAAVVPGFVNAHTHLDLSGYDGPRPSPGPFTSWLRAVIEYRRMTSAAQTQAAVAAGIRQCVEAGTTLLGDIAVLGASWELLAAAPVRAVVFYELIGLTDERARESHEAARAWLTVLPTPTCRQGLSPHAPYSVSRSLFLAAGALATRDQCPLAVHLAETEAELELLAHHAGDFVAFLRELGAWRPEAIVGSPGEVIRWCGVAPRLLLVHANYLSPATPLPTHASIVYCPRTHAAFGHREYPLRDFLRAGVRVALGTDSLASNPDLSVLEEARFVHRRYPDVPGSTVLRMATLSGAEALGWETETGSLDVGKGADLAVVPLPDEEAADPHLLLLRSDRRPAAVLWRGARPFTGGSDLAEKLPSHLKTPPPSV